MSSDPEYAAPPAEHPGSLVRDGVRVRRVRPAAPEPEELEEPAEEADEEEALAPSRGSLLPMVVAAAAGLLVVGLLAVIMLAPQGKNPAAAQPINLGGNTQSSMAKEELPRPGYLAPDFTLTTLDGQAVRLSSYRGVKPVWVNFWATWCPPCRAEMPEMQKVYEKYKDKGIEILGVDVQEDNVKVGDFVKQGGFGWNFLLDGDATVSRNYYVSGIPTHVFIGRDGVIKDLVVSGLTADMMESEVSKLLTP